MTGIRVGEATKPGPTSKAFRFVSANISNLATYGHQLAEQQVEYIIGQEHSTPPHKRTEAIRQLKPWSTHLSQLDSECEQPTGGVFLMQRATPPPLTPKPQSKHLKQLNGKGRVQLYAVQLDTEITILIYNIYGWTNANCNKEAAARTNNMLQAILDDMGLQPAGPRLVVGDLNGDPPTFQTLQQALDTNQLIDVGSQAHRWKEVANDYTCRAPGTKEPTRRDYLFATPDAYKHISHFHVQHESGFDVHDPLHFTITTQQQHTKTHTTLKQPASLNHLLIKQMVDRYGRPTKQPTTNDNSSSEQTDDTRANNTTTQPPTYTHPFRHLPNQTTSSEPLWQDIGDDDPRTLQEQGDEDSPTACIRRGDYTKEQQEEFLAQLHQHMDDHLGSQQTLLESKLAQQEHEQMLHLWAATIENSIFDFVDASHADRRKHKGHGRVNMQPQKPHSTPRVHNNQLCVNHNHHTEWLHNKKQCNRLGNIKAHLILLGQHFDRQGEGTNGDQAAEIIYNNSRIISIAQGLQPMGGEGGGRAFGTPSVEGADAAANNTQQQSQNTEAEVHQTPQEDGDHGAGWAAGTPGVGSADAGIIDPIPNKPQPTNGKQWEITASKTLAHQVKLYCKNIRQQPIEQTTRATMQQKHIPWRRLQIQLTRLHKQHQEHLEKQYQQISKQSKQASATRFHSNHSQTHINRAIKQQHTQPMQAIQRPPHPDTPNQPGTYTTDPDEIDKVIQDAWAPIYNGNAQHMEHLVDTFFQKYEHHIHRAPATTVPDITWEEVKYACTHGSNSAPGMDGWTKLDLSWLSNTAYQWLARCLNSIEATQQWPTSITKARAVFLSKDEQDMGNPMAYRILKITSALYRLWGSIRMQHLGHWISTWADPAMFAGVPGAGAEEGWWLTQLDMELKQATGGEVTAASIDVYKCFDQLVRPLVVALARAAGMPTNILLAYEAFQSELVIHNQIGTTIGKPHQHRCSIPQGCPFSMALVALLMRPWISTMRANQVEPRVLADDLFLSTSRQQHASRMVHGMNLTRQYFTDVGARVADNKCFVTSTCAATRARLRTIRWATIQPSHNTPGNDDGGQASGTPSVGSADAVVIKPRPAQTTHISIQVVNHFRDLGAHVTMDHTNHNNTLAGRLQRATIWVRRLTHLPITHTQKHEAIRTMILPAALYGSEVGHCPKAELLIFETAIAQALGPKSARKSLALTMEMCSTRGEIDPRAHMLTRKVSLLLRILAKYPKCKVKAQALLCAYQTQQLQGTAGWDPTGPQQPYHQHHGPICQILSDLHGMHAHITSDFTIHQHNEAPLPLLQTPWQCIKPLTIAIAQRARYNQHHTQRNHTQHTPQLDHQALHKALSMQTSDDRAIVRYIGTGAAWTQGHLQNIDPQAQGHCCKLCGSPETSIEHGIWKCPVVLQTAKLIRQKQHTTATEQQVKNQTQQQEQWVEGMLAKHGSEKNTRDNHSDPTHTSYQHDHPPCNPTTAGSNQVPAPAAGTSGVGSADSMDRLDQAEESEHETEGMATGYDLDGNTIYNHTTTTAQSTTTNTGHNQNQEPAAGTPGVGSAEIQGMIETGDDKMDSTTQQHALPYDHPDRFPIARKTKQAQQLFDIEVKDLPTALRFGLPPDMTNQLHTTFWALTPHQTHTQAPHMRKRMGIADSTRKQRIVARQNNQEAQEQLGEHGLQHSTARQAFQHLRGQHPPTPNTALPDTCHDRPPTATQRLHRR